MNVGQKTEMKVEQTIPLLCVSNIAQSVGFYRDGLGFEVASKWEPEGKLAWCWLRHGGATLMLQQADEEDPRSEERGKGVTFYFLCNDADVVYHEITERGVKATKPSVAHYGMKQTLVNDPDGYELCFENPTEIS